MVITQVLHKAFSTSLALLVLLSTVSFTVEKHYCGNTLIDVSVFSEANKCGMESTNTKAVVTKKSCCKNTVDVVEGQDELLKASFNDLDKTQKNVLTVYLYSYKNLFESLPKQIIPHKDYSPPNLIADIQVLDQVFLI